MKLINLLLKIAGLLAVTSFCIYIVWMLLLPQEISPPTNLLNCNVKQIDPKVDDRFISFELEKVLKDSEIKQFLSYYRKLNPKFNKRDLTILAGFNRGIDQIYSVKAKVLLDCRQGEYLSVDETYLNYNTEIVHSVSNDTGYMSVTVPYKSSWLLVPSGSILDKLALSYCDRSRY